MVVCRHIGRIWILLSLVIDTSTRETLAPIIGLVKFRFRPRLAALGALYMHELAFSSHAESFLEGSMTHLRMKKCAPATFGAPSSTFSSIS